MKKTYAMPLLFLFSAVLCSCTFSFTTGSNSGETASSKMSATSRTSTAASTSVTPGGGAAELLTSTNDGSQYGAPKRSAGTSGTHYVSKSNAIPEKTMDEASGTICLTPDGTQKLLVIPVIIDDYAANATSANRERIYQTFFGNPSDTSWESLSSFYYKSSFGKLLLQGSVSDWYDCGFTASALAAQKSSDASFDPTWTVLRGAVAWYKETYHTDATEFDNDGDGRIDGVWLVYSAPDLQNDRNIPQGNLFWAYTYWDNREKASTSSPTACVYCWGSYDFMDTGYGTSGTDAHTFCHETGHMMGLEDYYVSSKISGTKNYGPMGLIDMMDGNIIDHNAFSKFALGWIDPLVVSGATSLTLKPSATSGQAVLIPSSDSWNGSAFDEYMLLEYYTPDLLNLADSQTAYPNRYPAFTENGVRIYHVDERLARAIVSGSSASYSYTDTLVHSASSYTIRAHSNSNAYNVLDKNFRALQAIDCTQKRNFDTECSGSGTRYHADNTTLFQDGDTFSFDAYQNSFPNYYYNSKSTMNDGSTFPYQITFSAMSSEGITLTISAA